MKKWLVVLMVVLVFLLHQDCWNWKRYEPLFFGFVPVGLAYHAAYAILATVMMAVLVKVAWPKWLEQVEEHQAEKPGKDEQP